MEYEEYDLQKDPNEIDRIEAENALRQYDFVISIIEETLEAKTFYLTSETIKTLNSLSVDRLHSKAGMYRTQNIHIRFSQHTPPSASEVFMLVEDMCLYYNANTPNKTPISLAAYCLWRLNWIHPFWNGNGRTARALCYLLLGVGYKSVLPGRTTILAQIAMSKQRYYKMLELADLAHRQGRDNLEPLESYLTTLLVRQLDWA